MKLRGLEPDECYCLGQKKEISDLAIEVVITSGIVNKLDIYQGLGVTEVWQWQDGQFLIHHLRPTGYEQITTSELLPNLDPQQLASYVNSTDQFVMRLSPRWGSDLKSSNHYQRMRLHLWLQNAFK